MKIELSSHPGVLMTDPEIELIGTFDDPINEAFTPHLVFKYGENINIGHVMPSQPYVKGTWTDANVQESIDNYLKQISL